LAFGGSQGLLQLAGQLLKPRFESFDPPFRMGQLLPQLGVLATKMAVFIEELLVGRLGRPGRSRRRCRLRRSSCGDKTTICRSGGHTGENADPAP